MAVTFNSLVNLSDLAAVLALGLSAASLLFSKASADAASKSHSVAYIAKWEAAYESFVLAVFALTPPKKDSFVAKLESYRGQTPSHLVGLSEDLEGDLRKAFAHESLLQNGGVAVKVRAALDADNRLAAHWDWSRSSEQCKLSQAELQKAAEEIVVEMHTSLEECRQSLFHRLRHFAPKLPKK